MGFIDSSRRFGQAEEYFHFQTAFACSLTMVSWRL